jgi:adenylate cyclase class 2
MHTEIEAKLKVDSHTKTAKRLAEMGAEFVEEQLQRDCYFDDLSGILTKGDRCFRLRQVISDKGKKIFLTYKGAKEAGKFKKRQEIEVEVGDYDSVEKLLLALGYQEILVFEKRRQMWRFNECMISLDQLPLLGNFVEIEGANEERIAKVQQSLGLGDLQHIEKSYALLMKKKVSKLGIVREDICFKT